MLDKLNVYLKVEEQVGYSGKEKRVVYLPVNSEIENMKLCDIPAYVGMENAKVVVTYFEDRNSAVSSAYAACWLADENTVSRFVVFSLMEAIENCSSVKRNIPNPEIHFIQRLEALERLAIGELSKIIDSSKLNEICERIRSFLSTVQIYDLIDEMEIIPNNSEIMQ